MKHLTEKRVREIIQEEADFASVKKYLDDIQELLLKEMCNLPAFVPNPNRERRILGMMFGQEIHWK
jgi:hypothetical protein